ncbi:MAG: hypothetical protein CFE26_23435, partial [Verrucomicrobiales bacterium VVV1]
MYVPKEVMGGEAFYYNKLSEVEFFSELPLGCDLTSKFFNPDDEASRIVPATIVWTATLPAGVDCDVKIVDASGNASTAGQTTTLESNSEHPFVHLKFVSKMGENILFDGDFEVTLTAKVRIATAEHAEGGNN